MNVAIEIQKPTLAEKVIDTLNSHSDERILSLYALDYSGEDITGGKLRLGNESVRTWMHSIYSAFPNIHYELQYSVENEDDLVLYWKATGNHHGTFLKIPPTGLPVTISGVSLLKMKNGKIREGRLIWDMAGVLRQMGLLPQMP